MVIITPTKSLASPFVSPFGRMRLLQLRSAWGLANLRAGDRYRTMAALRTSGWHGVEASLDDIGGTYEERRECLAAAQSEGMSFILSAYSSWTNYEGPFDAARTVASHGDALLAQLRQIAELSSSTQGSSPVIRVNAHSGSDAWSESEALEYFERAVADVRALDVLPAVSHETHRGRYISADCM